MPFLREDAKGDEEASTDKALNAQATEIIKQLRFINETIEKVSIIFSYHKFWSRSVSPMILCDIMLCVFI